MEQENIETISKPNKITLWFLENKNLLIKVFLFTFIFGLMAHAFAYFNLNLSHDVLNEYELGFHHKIRLGRFLQPLVRYVLGEIIFLPWVDGIASLFFIACAVFLICKTFNYDKIMPIAIVAGVFVTNISVISLTATYGHDLSGDMLALYLSVLAFSFYIKNKDSFNFKKASILALLIIAVAGLYQSYFAVTVSLIFIHTLICLLKGNNFKDEFKKLLFCLLTLLIALVLYLLISFVITKAINLELYSEDSYNSLANLKHPLDIIIRIPNAYANFFNGLFLPTGFVSKSPFFIIATIISVVNFFLFVLSIVIAIMIMVKHKVKISNIILISILFVLLPVAMNCVYLLSGVGHVLLIFSYATFYILVLEIFKIANEKLNLLKLSNLIKYVSFGTFLVIASNISLANSCYVKKDLEQQATLSYITRVVDRVEEMPNYVPEETEIIFIGSFYEVFKIEIATKDDIIDYDYIAAVTGMGGASSITYYQTIKSYFKNVMQYDVKIADEKIKNEYAVLDEVKNMPAFPNQDSVKEIDGRIVVKIN
ncbi:MAG: glucosyltransferase domain-containing protein [Clostridia bacterium]|nr:glucosyltransferase domain-containing protein [Clostridia bacterium]